MSISKFVQYNFTCDECRLWQYVEQDCEIKSQAEAIRFLRDELDWTFSKKRHLCPACNGKLYPDDGDQ